MWLNKTSPFPPYSFHVSWTALDLQIKWQILKQDYGTSHGLLELLRAVVKKSRKADRTLRSIRRLIETGK